MNNNDDREAKTADLTGVVSHSPRYDGFSYLHIPAVNVHQSVLFYERVFGWEVRERDTDHPRFDNGSGYISGAWVTDQALSREPGLLPYVFVESIDNTIEQIKAQGVRSSKLPSQKQTYGSRHSLIRLATCSVSSSKAFANREEWARKDLVCPG